MRPILWRKSLALVRVEWTRFSDRYSTRQMHLPRSLAHLKRKISGKKWVEAKRWAAGWVTGRKYKLPTKQQPDGTVAGSSKRLASRFYQLKTGHYLIGQYLKWTGNQPTAKCWWCPRTGPRRGNISLSAARTRNASR